MAETPHVVKVSVTDVPEFMSVLGTALGLYESIYRSPAEVLLSLPPSVSKAYGDVQKAVQMWRDRGYPMPEQVSS